MLRSNLTRDGVIGEFSSILASFNHLICPLQHAAGIVNPICFAAFRLMMKLELRCLLHRQISRFGAFQDLVHVNSRKPIVVNNVRPIGHEANLVDKLLLEVNSRQVVFAGKSTIRFLSAKIDDCRLSDRAYLFLLCGLKALFKPLGSN